MFDTLFHNAVVLTLNPAFDVFRPGWVGVVGGRVAGVGPGVTAQASAGAAREHVDCGGGILMPGLVNAHTHLPMTLFRGLADDLPLMDWLQHYIFPAERRHLRPETVLAGARLACAELLLSGTTTCCDGYFLESTVAQAVLASGIRAVLGQGVVDFPAPGVPDPARNVVEAETFIDRWLGVEDRITPSVFCHSPYACSPGTLQRAKAAAARRGVRFQIHAAETRAETDRCLAEFGASPVALLDRLGLLDPDTLVVHGVWLSQDDIGRLADRGVPVVHCPESNMKLASGIAPVPRMLSAGITVALGTDGAASNNDLDLFREMDTAAKLHKAATGDPTVMGARTVLRMATVDGARALGMADAVGSIETGKWADLLVLESRAPSLVPDFHPESLVVYAADGNAVKDVMVAGEFVVRDRRLCRQDLGKILTEVRRLALDIGGPRRGQVPAAEGRAP